MLLPYKHIMSISRFNVEYTRCFCGIMIKYDRYFLNPLVPGAH